MKIEKIKLILICSLILFGMIAFLSSLSIAKYVYFADSGFVSENAVSILYANKFEELYDNSIENIINEFKENHESFTIAMEYEGERVGIFSYNDQWMFPLQSRRLFSSQEMESKEPIYLTNQKVSGKVVGKPIYTNNKIYQNIYSIKLEKNNRQFMPVTIYSNKSIDGFQENVKLNDYAILSQHGNVFLQLYIIISISLMILACNYYYKQNRRIIGIKKLCGVNDMSIFREYIAEIILILLTSYFTSVVMFCLIMPELFINTYFRKSIFVMMIVVAIALLSLVLIISLVLFIIIKYASIRKILSTSE